MASPEPRQWRRWLRHRWVGRGVALAMLAGALGYAFVHHRSTHPTSLPGRAASQDAEKEEAEDWCAPGLERVDGAGCFAAPSATKSSRARTATALLVYLHGRYWAETTGEEVERQSRVARLANARGIAVLALRGRQGECTQPEYAAWWCWPSNEHNAGDGPAFVARWTSALHAAKVRTGPGPSLLLGFSNGAYFATLIATRNLFDFDAIAIAHGGPVEPTQAVGRNPPLLLITAREDASDPEMQRLDAELTRERWQHTMVERDGGHALPDWDVDQALDFFASTGVLPPPVTPPPSRAAP